MLQIECISQFSNSSCFVEKPNVSTDIAGPQDLKLSLCVMLSGSIFGWVRGTESKKGVFQTTAHMNKFFSGVKRSEVHK